MDRKQIYAKIKELNLAEQIRKEFGDNYTRVSSANLEAFITKHNKPAKKEASKKPVCKCKKDNPWFYLGSILVAKKVITKQELDTLMGMI